MATAVKKSAPPAAAPVVALPEPQIEKTVAAVSAPAAQIQETVRKALEKGVVDTRAAYAKAKAAAEETSGALESSCATAVKGVIEFNAKALDALRANAEANFDFLKSVISVKSVPEFVTLQSEHARQQAEAITAQAKEIAALSQKVAAESVAPLKTQFAKTFKLAV
jgi:phasin